MPGFFFCKLGNGLEEAAMNQAPVGLENGADRAASSRENPVLFPAPKKKARQKRRASFFVNSGNGLEEAAVNQAPVGLENGADRAASSRENPVLFPAPKKKARQKRRASFFVNSGNGLEEAAVNQAPVGLENRIGNMVYWAQPIGIYRRCFRENETSRSMRDRSFSDRGFDLFRYSEKTYSHAFK